MGGFRLRLDVREFADDNEVLLNLIAENAPVSASPLLKTCNCIANTLATMLSNWCQLSLWRVKKGHVASTQPFIPHNAGDRT